MVQKKYRVLYSSKSSGKPGPKGPDQELIRLVVDIKHRNPRMGYDRVAMQVLQAFGVEVDKHVIRRILAKHYKPIYPGGPSWLTFLGQAKDSLWSIDLFRCESIGPARPGISDPTGSCLLSISIPGELSALPLMLAMSTESSHAGC